VEAKRGVFDILFTYLRVVSKNTRNARSTVHRQKPGSIMRVDGSEEGNGRGLAGVSLEHGSPVSQASQLKDPNAASSLLSRGVSAVGSANSAAFRSLRGLQSAGTEQYR
jgi:hypothetical protein